MLGYVKEPLVEQEKKEKLSGYKNSLKKILMVANGRDLIFYGTDALSIYVYQDLLEMGFDIKYFIDDYITGNREKIFGKEVRESIELMYENPQNVFIITFKFKGHGEIYEKLVNLGFKYERDFWLCGIGGFNGRYDVIDSLLGFNRYYNNILGFDIYGDMQNENSYRILVLGGSTTDPTFGNNKCWCKFLYEKLYMINSNVVVINGGLAGYSASHEFFKFVRDGINFNPDMVLTFDGFNDIGCWATDLAYPSLNPYQIKLYNYIEKKGDFAPDTLDLRSMKKIVHGFEQYEKKDYERWIENIIKIHGVADIFNIIHIGFLQPMLKTGKAILEEKQESLILEACKAIIGYNIPLDGTINFYKNVNDFILNNNYMFDLSNIFDNKKNMYYDFCHSTDAGHKVIADAIYNVVLPRIYWKG